MADESEKIYLVVKGGGSVDQPGWRELLLSFVGVCLVGAVVYGHTLQAPWYLDDIPNIVENPTVHQLGAAFSSLLSGGRGVAELTFAVNYRLGGLDVVGFHLANIAIHLLTSWLIFLLVLRVFPGKTLLALGGALIFVAHPIQTQAVTYIIQRMTSLAALFFFLALYLYVLAREASDKSAARHWLFYGGSLICGALAVMTKQNTAILPLALLLFDRFFLDVGKARNWPQMLVYVAPFALVPLLQGWHALVAPLLSDTVASHVSLLPQVNHLQNLSPLHYLVTQFTVIWIYLRLVFLPYGQALEYDLPIVESIWIWQNYLGLLGILLLLAVAYGLRNRNPVFAAGIFWFFLALAVESTIIPLDPVFEHRLYLPMFGVSLVVISWFAKLPRNITIVGGMVLLVLLATLTWQRNALWNDRVAFYLDNIRKAPNSERALFDLANALREQGNLENATIYYHRALAVNPDYVPIYINLAILHAGRQEFQEAVAVLQEGLRRDPNHFMLYNNLGVAFNLQGQPHEAAYYLRQATAQEPDNFLGYLNLGMALRGQGRFGEALKSLQEASRLAPENTGVVYQMASLNFALGDSVAAWENVELLRRLDPAMADDLLRRYGARSNP